MKEQQSGSRRTNRNIVLSVSASMVAKVLVLLQSTVISAVFGATARVDILFYLLNLIVVVTTFASAVNQLVVVANVIKARNEKTQPEYHGFVRFVYTIYLVMALVLGVFLFFFSRPFLRAVTAFSQADIILSATMQKVMALVVFFAVINTFLMDIFASFRIFILPMVNDVVKSVLIILFILVPGGRVTVDMIAYGMFAAYLLQFITMQVSFVRVAGFRLGFGYSRLGGLVKKNATCVLLAQGVTSVETMIMMSLVSTFPAGYFMALSLARRLMVTVMNVLISQFAIVVGVDLIEYSTSGDNQKLGETFTGYLKVAGYIMIPVAAVCAVNAQAIISLLFGYGKFTAENITIASRFLAVLSLAFITGLVDAFLQRLIVAKQMHHKTYLFQVAQSVLCVALMFVFIQTFGYLGAPLGLVISNLLYDIVLGVYLLKTEYRFLSLKSSVQFFLANMAFMLAGCAAGVWGLRFFHLGMGFGGNLLYLVFSAAAMCAVYVLCGLLYKPNRNTMGALLQVFSRVLSRHSRPKRGKLPTGKQGGAL